MKMDELEVRKAYGELSKQRELMEWSNVVLFAPLIILAADVALKNLLDLGNPITLLGGAVLLCASFAAIYFSMQVDAQKKKMKELLG